MEPAITSSASLPIDERRNEIVAAINAHQVLVVAGETGSGKSTQLPQMCLQAGRGRVQQGGDQRVSIRLAIEKRDDDGIDNGNRHVFMKSIGDARIAGTDPFARRFVHLRKVDGLRRSRNRLAEQLNVAIHHEIDQKLTDLGLRSLLGR